METQTLDERIMDGKKIPLDNGFIGELIRIAELNGKTSNDIWQLWRKYSHECENRDQSAVMFEFLQWNKLKGE